MRSYWLVPPTHTPIVISMHMKTLPFEHFTKSLSVRRPLLTLEPALGSLMGKEEVGLGLEALLAKAACLAVP